MASKIGICNMALINLGHMPIISLDYSGKAVTLLNQVYDMVLDDVLREHFWNFALKRVSLPLLAETPAFGYSKAFQLPEDFIRVYEPDYDSIDYRIEYGRLLADDETFNLRYVARVDDPGRYDSKFVGTLAARLAHEIGYALTGSRTASNDMWQIYKDKLRAAMSIDGQDDPTEIINADDPLILARL